MPHVKHEENFRRWFRDSKVVDAAGQPLVVYHGTARTFKSFDPWRTGTNWKQDKFGIFFSSSPIEAAFSAERSARRGGAQNIIPVHVNLQNPLILTARRGQNVINDFDTFKDEYQRRLINGGRDGIISTDGVDTLVVALHSRQIKSSLGNSGSFDPDSTDIADYRASNARKALEFIAARNKNFSPHV